jgi:iron complex transport system substrate-binding protein
LKRKKKGILAALLMCLFLFAACSTGGGQDQPSAGTQAFYTFTDSAGTAITLPEKPQKVAVLFSSFADVWRTAGGEVSITVGESIDRGFAEENVLLVDGGAGKTIDNELLISYKPDFVICSADIQAQAEMAKILNDAKIPAAQFKVESFDDYLDMLKVCTDITENAEAYQKYGVDVKKEIDELLTDVKEKADSAEQKNILFVRAGSKFSATKAKTAADNFVCVMLKELGTYNIAEKAEVLLDGLSFEEVLLSNPDYIFITTMGDESAAKAYMENLFTEDGWKDLSAVKEKNYCFLPKDLFHFKPNARWNEAYRYLANFVYSEKTGE